MFDKHGTLWVPFRWISKFGMTQRSFWRFPLNVRLRGVLNSDGRVEFSKSQMSFYT